MYAKRPKKIEITNKNKKKSGIKGPYQVSSPNMEDIEGVILTTEQVSKGLKTLGIHPLALRHSFLELSLPAQQIIDISILSQYPLVMYLDISNNKIQSLAPLEHLTALVTLKARHNQLVHCLDFLPPLCNEENAWSDGKQAVGSMLTLADLCNNRISKLQDLSDHRFLECLLLAHNKIQTISGLHNLKYLQVRAIVNVMSSCSTSLLVFGFV